MPDFSTFIRDFGIGPTVLCVGVLLLIVIAFFKGGKGGGSGSSGSSGSSGGSSSSGGSAPSGNSSTPSS